MTGKLRTLLLTSTGILIPLAANAQCAVQNAGPPLVGGGNVFGSIVSQWIQYFKSKVDGNNGSLCSPTFSGTVGFNVPALALPNPTTATTQSQNDASTKVATDQFVWNAMGQLIAFGGRLTLTSLTPIMPQSINVINATAIYVDAYLGNLMATYNGTSFSMIPIPNREVAVNLSASIENSTDIFDVWGYNNAGVVGACVATNGSGAGWLGDSGSLSSRGTTYTQIASSLNTTTPYLANLHVLTNCYNGTANIGPISIYQGTYLGSFLTTAAGQTGMNFGGSLSGGSVGFQYLWNMYNRIPYRIFSQDTGTPYTYSSATVRVARGGSAQLSALIGNRTDTIGVTYDTGETTAATSGAKAGIGIGLNGTATVVAQPGICQTVANVAMECSPMEMLVIANALGQENVFSLEFGDGANANQFDSRSVNILTVSGWF